MRLEEKIKVMQHYEDGGEVEISLKNDNNWYIGGGITWNWEDKDYRIVQKPLLYEWIYEAEDGVFNTDGFLLSEREAKQYYKAYISYHKTGRYFDPNDETFHGK